MVALQLPIGTERGFRGVIDLVGMKAHMYKPDGDGKPTIEEIPAALADEAKEAHEKLVEMVAEGDDELMEEFFREGTIPLRGSYSRRAQRHRGGKDFPRSDDCRRCTTSGTASLLTFIADVFPASRRAFACRIQGAGRERRSHRAEIRRCPAVFVVCVQNAGRSFCRAHQLFQSDERRAEK